MSPRRAFPLLCIALLLGVASAAHATAPGENGRIVFASTRDGNSELYSVNADGSALRRLTWSGATEQSPSVASDGRIAYEGPFNDRFRIWSMNADGSGQRQVSSDGYYLAQDGEPAWSPDGTQIAFGSTRGGGWNLWLMNSDGSGLHQVSDVSASSVAWSPDGRKLAYAWSGAIGIVGVDGSDPHPITAPGAPASGPSWSPNGDRIVFSRNNAAGYPGELFVVGADGTGEQQLTTGGYKNANPSWSPDGTQIVYQRDGAPSGWNLWVIGADGAGAHQITFGSNDLQPDWSRSQAVPEPTPPDAPTIDIFAPTERDVWAQGYPSGPAYYVCSSNVSFIVSCQGDVPLGAPIDVSTAGARTFTVRAVDAAGRTATKTVVYHVLDLVAPSIDIRTPADGATYDVGARVFADYSCTDAGGEGVTACSGDLLNGFPIDTRTAGQHTFTVWAADFAGNIRNKTVTYSVGAPTVHLMVPADGATYELRSTVLADYSCSIAACSGPVASGTAIDTSSTGTKTFTVTAGSTRVTHTYTVAGPPQIQIAAPVDGAAFTLGASATPSYACSSPWGVKVVTCNGTALDTASVGTKTFIVTAADELGGTTTATRAYRVVFAFTGFDTPVSDGAIDGVKAGDSLPLKFSLQGNQGVNVVARISWRRASCTDWSALGDASPGQGRLSYNAAVDRYTELAATDAGWSGSCRIVDLQLVDGSRHIVNVRFR